MKIGFLSALLGLMLAFAAPVAQAQQAEQVSFTIRHDGPPMSMTVRTIVSRFGTVIAEGTGTMQAVRHEYRGTFDYIEVPATYYTAGSQATSTCLVIISGPVRHICVPTSPTVTDELISPSGTVGQHTAAVINVNLEDFDLGWPPWMSGSS